jgi:hypothetical protein
MRCVVFAVLAADARIVQEAGDEAVAADTHALPLLSILVPEASALRMPVRGSRLTRRDALGGAAAVAAGIPAAASAEVAGVNRELLSMGSKEADKYLKDRGFPALNAPSGFSPLVEYIGTESPANIDGQKVKVRAFDSTLLVRWAYPFGWLKESPTITENGEAGNAGANNFQNGDSSTFASLPLPRGKDLQSLGKDFYQGFIANQMSSDVYEDVKVSKLRPQTQADGTEMVLFDFTYTLLTRAGFTVNRRGVGSAMIAADAVVGVVAATTTLRYKELKPKLETIADTFRAYAVKKPDMISGKIA